MLRSASIAACSLAAGVAGAPDAPVIAFDDALAAAAGAPLVRGLELAAEARRALDGEIGPYAVNPELVLQPGWRVLRVESRGLDAQFVFTHPLPVDALGQARAEGVRWERAALAAQADATRLEQVVRIGRAWIERRIAEEQLATARAELEVARSVAEKARRAAELAALTAAEAAEAETNAALAAVAVVDAEGRVHDAGVLLAEALAGPHELVGTTGPLPDPPLPPEERWSTLVAKAAALPEPAALRLQADAARARAAERTALAANQWQVGVAGQREGTGDAVVWGTVSVTPAFSERGARERAQLVEASERAAGEGAAAAVRARSAVVLAVHEVQHARELREEIEVRLLPAAERFAELRRRQAQLGELDVTELLLARRTLANARGRLAEARAEESWAEVRLWLFARALEGAGAAR